MSGFLNDGLRDWIAVAGLALGIYQTWLAVKTTRASKERPPSSDGPRSRYPTSLKVASGALAASLLFLLVGAVFVFQQMDRPALTATDSFRQITTVQRTTFACVSLWALSYIVGNLAVQVWQKSKAEPSRGARAVVLVTPWLGAVVTIFAVIAFVWASGRLEPGKVIDDPAVAAASAFGFWTVSWATGAFIFAIGTVVSDKPGQ